MRNKITHPHPGPLPSRAREITVKGLYRKIAASACRPPRNDRTEKIPPAPLYKRGEYKTKSLAACGLRLVALDLDPIPALCQLLAAVFRDEEDILHPHNAFAREGELGLQGDDVAGYEDGLAVP